MKHCIVANELTILRMVWLGLRGREVYHVRTLPLVRMAAPLLDAVVGRLIGRGLVKPLAAVSPDLPWIEGVPGRGIYNSVQLDIEDRLHDALGYRGRGDAFTARYGYALQKAVTDYTNAVVFVLLFAEWAGASLPAGSWVLEGAPRHLDLVHRLYFGGPRTYRHADSDGAAALWNLLNLAAAVVGTLAWVAPRLRLRLPAEEPVHLAADVISPVEATILRRVSAAGRTVLPLFRTEEIARRYATEFAGTHGSRLGDTRLTPASAARLLAAAMGDWRELWAVHRRLEPGLFGQLCTMPFKRLVFSALHAMYRPRFFWGRDEYSVDHVVRNEVLRELGVVTLGLMHGIPMNTYVSQFRDIDCDKIFVIGLDIYQRLYHNSWPVGTQVIPIGGLHFSAERHSAVPRSRDIAYLLSVAKNSPRMLDEVFALARHYPDRTVWIKTKPMRDDAFTAWFDRMMATAPGNVAIHPSDDAYELLSKVSYALSNGTTLGAEAIQFRVASFVIDVDELEHFYYKNFPDLMVKDAAEMIRRIDAIEGGEPYPFERFEPLIRLSGPDPIDAILAEMAIETDRH